MTDRGGPRRTLGLVPGTVHLQEYDPSWRAEFDKIRVRLLGLVPGARIEHIGSTAVPGCVAKPIIDISVGLPPERILPVGAARTAGLEFRLFRSGTAMFRLEGEGGRSLAHVHVRDLGSEGEIQDLRFRDFLRASREAVQKYSNGKRSILAGVATRAEYSTAKEPLVIELVNSAKIWAKGTGWIPKAGD